MLIRKFKQLIRRIIMATLADLENQMLAQEQANAAALATTLTNDQNILTAIAGVLTAVQGISGVNGQQVQQMLTQIEGQVSTIQTQVADIDVQVNPTPAPAPAPTPAP
jgi:hypothetical protein